MSNLSGISAAGMGMNVQMSASTAGAGLPAGGEQTSQTSIMSSMSSTDRSDMSGYNNKMLALTMALIDILSGKDDDKDDNKKSMALAVMMALGAMQEDRGFTHFSSQMTVESTGGLNADVQMNAGSAAYGAAGTGAAGAATGAGLNVSG